ncbi:MAG: hypothetical protein KC635_09675, partial [Myxococcales bacterium]|nr:hypothetical protein [Myxococcales bacterium]
MARALRRLGVSLSLVLIAAGVARADVSLLWTVPPTFTPTTSTSLTNDFSAQLAYTLSGGTYAPLALHFELPAGMQLLTTTQPATFTSDCANLVVGPRTCNFTAASIAVPGTGVSGAITISLRATRFQFPNGTVVPFEATATGAFTPTSGTAQAIAATASATSTAVANAVNVFHEIGNDGHTYVQGWGVGPDGLTTGYYYTLNIRPRNNGNAPYDADATITVTLPPALVYVGAYSSTNNAATPTSTVNDLVIDDEPLVGDAGGEVIARLPRAQSSASTNNDHFYWPHLHVEVFIPCGPIPVGLNNVDYAVDVLVTSIETDATGAHVAETLSATIANPPGVTTGGGACGEGFLLDKRATVNTRGTGRSAPYELRVTPPKGVVPLEDVLIVDPLPVGHGGVTVTTTNAPNLAVYTCVLPGVTTFDKDTFLTDYKDDECALGTARGPSATHVVGWDATWGDGDEDLGLSYLTVNVAIPYDYLVDGYPNPMVNTFTFSARGTFDGEPVTLAGSDDAAINIIDGSRPSTSNISNASWTTTPPVLSPGESGMATFNPTLNGNYSPLLNPWVDLTFPDYVTIDDVAAVSVGSGCSGLTSTVTTTPTGVRVAWTDGTGTYYYPSNCMYVRVRFTLDAGAPYLNDDTFDFGAITRAENEDPAVTPTGVVRRFTAAVPPEIRTNAVATCAPGDGAPLFTVTTTNSGGTPLTNVVSTLFLPAVGDGASTEGAVFVAVEDAPVDATIRTFDGATWSAYPPAVPSAVERVEVTIPALAATDVSTFVVRTQAPGAAAVLYPRSTASADGLGAADSGLGVPFEFAECPATVTVVKYWDAAGTGFQDPGAPLLPGWHFIVTDADGLTVLEGDTGADGTVAFSLHQGTYGIAE